MTEKTERGKQRGGDGKFIVQGSKKWKNNYNPKMSCKGGSLCLPDTCFLVHLFNLKTQSEEPG